MAVDLQIDAAPHIEVIPTGRALAAEIRGVDLRDVGERAFAAIRRAWLDHLVLLFRGHHLGDEQLITFSRRLGELDLAQIQETGRRFAPDPDQRRNPASGMK